MPIIKIIIELLVTPINSRRKQIQYRSRLFKLIAIELGLVNTPAPVMRGIALPLVALLAACEAADDSLPPAQPDFADGVFIDSPVAGLSYSSGERTGITDTDGSYVYQVGERIEFALGGIVLGSSPGSRQLSPLDLVNGDNVAETDPTVTNIARFLQTLDDDANPDNGIVLNTSVQAAALGQTMNFDQSIDGFAADANVQALVAQLTQLTQAGERSLISAEDAQAHLRASLVAELVGDYFGVLGGDDAARFKLSVAADGGVSGSGESDLSQDGFSLSGQLAANGQGAATLTGTNGSSLSGSLNFNINSLLTMQGIWQTNAGAGQLLANIDPNRVSDREPSPNRLSWARDSKHFVVSQDVVSYQLLQSGGVLAVSGSIGNNQIGTQQDGLVLSLVNFAGAGEYPLNELALRDPEDPFPDNLLVSAGFITLQEELDAQSPGEETLACSTGDLTSRGGELYEGNISVQAAGNGFSGTFSFTAGCLLLVDDVIEGSLIRELNVTGSFLIGT